MKNFRKLFLAVTLVLVAASVSAQLSYGVKAGFNASTFNGIDDAKYKPGFSVGVAAQYMFAEQMGIETGLYYSVLGVKGEDKDSEDIPMVGNISVKQETTFSPSYLQLPVSFLYKFNVGTGLDLYPSIGLYLGYGIAGKAKVKTEIDAPAAILPAIEAMGYKAGEESGDFFGKDIKTNRFDLGATVGLNLQYSQFTIGLGYEYGFLKINDFDSDKDWTNGNIKVSVGYFF